MTRENRQVVLTILFSIIMVMSMVAPFAGGALAMDSSGVEPTHSVGSEGDILTQQTVDSFQVTENLSVWERVGARPAVVNRSNTVTSIQTPETQVYLNTGDVITTSTQKEGVFAAGDNVTFKFDPAERGVEYSGFNGDEFRVLVVQLDGNRDAVETFLDTEDVNATDVKNTFENNVSNYEVQNAGEIIDGEASATVTLDEPGSYLLLGHVGGTVYEDGDDRPTFNDTTVIGVDSVTAQEDASTIEVDDTVELGENVTVNASSNLKGENISHTTIVFDETTFSDQNVDINITEDVSADLRSEDVIVESEIAAVQGVTNVEPNTKVSGATIASERFNGTVNLEEQSTAFFSIRNALVDGFDIRDQVGGAAEFKTTNNTTINASVTARGDQARNITNNVETLETWNSGNYTVVHIATDEDTGNISTDRKTVMLKDSIDEGGDGDDGSDGEDGDDGNGGGGSGGGGGGDITPPANGGPDITITERERGVSVSVTNIPANTPTRIGTGRNVASGGATVTNFTVDLVQDRDELNLEVDAVEEPPESVPEPANVDTLSYVDVDAGELTDDDYNSVEWEFTVDQERIDELDSSPENVQLNRYNETSGEWESFETTHEGGNEFTATVPGFSTFAITTAAIDDGDTDDGTDSTDDGTDSTDDGTDSTDGDGDDGTDGDGDDSPFGLIILLVVLAVAVALGVGYYQTQQK